MLEVELKFSIDDALALRERLAALGAGEFGAETQADAYFNHPSRDFAQTDEALRVRTVEGESMVTYKGPKRGGVAKTRFELELPLAPGTAEGWAGILTRLGFREVAVVRKRRTLFTLDRDGLRFEVSIDEVEGLGLFAEVETLADEASRDAAERAVGELATSLGLSARESRSYLELLLGR